MLKKTAPRGGGAEPLSEYQRIVRKCKRGYTVDAIIFLALAIVYTVALVWYCMMGGGVVGALVILINIIAVAVQAGYYLGLRGGQNSDR